MHRYFRQGYFSYFLLLASILVSIVGFFYPSFQFTYAFSGSFFLFDNPEMFFLQSVLFQFLHFNLLHLLMNGYFLYAAGPAVEQRMSPSAFFAFFITTTIWIIGGLVLFSEGRTIGISGFCNAILAYITIDLYKTRHPQAGAFGTMLAVNICIGLMPSISFVGHFFGATWGIFWYFFLHSAGKNFFKK